MKIIKEGHPDAVKRRVRFRCNRCGCVFEADFGEYTIDFFRNEESYSCECPTCSAIVSFSGAMR